MIDNDRSKTWLRLMEKTWEFCLPMHLAVSWHTPAGVLPIHQPIIVCQHNVRKISYVMLDASSKYYTIRWILGTRGAKKVFIPLWFRSFNPSEMQVVYWTYESRNRDHLPMKRTTISLQDLSPKHCTKDTKPAPSPPANLPDDFLMFTQCQPMTWIVIKCWDRIKLTSASHVHPCVH